MFGRYRGRVAGICTAAVFALFFLITPLAEAGEFFAGFGFADNTESGSANTQASWYVAYYQPLTDWSMFSITYLNEGHQPDHKRDGFAPQIWARTPVMSDLRFGVGIGPYVFFDTRTTETDVSDNHHGLGVMSSASVTWYHLAPLLFQVRADYIQAFSSFNGFSGSFAVGFYLDDKKTAGQAKALPDTRNEIDFYVGRTVMNSDHSTAVSFSAEYRRKLFRYLDWSIGFLHEGDSRPVGRYGLLSELWLVKDFYANRLVLGFGAGPYWAHDRYDDDNVTRNTVAGAVSLTAAWRITPHLGIRATFHRIVTNYSWDSDVFLGGLALSF